MRQQVWRLLRNCWMLALVWNTADIVSKNTLSHSGPIIPGRGVPLFFNSTHEAGQNLALGALIVLCTSALTNRPALRAVLIPVALIGLAVFADSDGRGMRIGIALGALVVMLLSLTLHGMPHFNTRLLKLAVAAVPVLALVSVAVPDRVVKLAHLDRFAEADPSDPEGTAGWRMIWWQRLYAEVMNKNPAFGLGFGESLYVYHLLLEASQDEYVIRSPHNFNVTVFSRMGIVGLLYGLPFSRSASDLCSVEFGEAWREAILIPRSGGTNWHFGC